MARILVVNPNSSEEMTLSIDRSLDALRAHTTFTIHCTTLAEGPPGIETQGHIESVVQPMVALMQKNRADAYVIACFSDPGLALAREVLPVPVVGIAESSMLLALGLGYRFGVVALSAVSVRRHLRYIRSIGLESRVAGDRAIELGVHDASGDAAIARIIEAGKILRDVDDANVLILGCAGMGQRRKTIEDAVGLPVIDPTQAAVMRAIGLVSLDYSRAA